jgi:hypothetical protein
MMHGFIFSEIDPEHPAVAINAARDILEEILNLKHPFPAHHILDETSTMKGKDLGREIEVFRRAFTKLKLQKFEPKSHDLKEDLCLLHFFIAYEGKIESGEKLKFNGNGHILLGMQYGYWYLEDIVFPGFSAA